ncbi:MAG: transglycosylase SLT domain-containing protein [Desulfomonilaceae bacterium]
MAGVHLVVFFAIQIFLRYQVTLKKLAVFSSLALVVTIAGCGSKNGLLKAGTDNGHSLTNAFSKVFAYGTNKLGTDRSQAGEYPDVPLEENDPRVKKFLREYVYEKRNSTRNYLIQAEPYLPMVRKVVTDNGLPIELAYLFLLESGANPEARSPANALGMWQFMPATARSYGLRVDSYVDERLDPEKSTKAALLYLKDLYGMFGCWRLALSAYNSGENKLNKVLCQEDATEYDDICSSRKLRKETREFLPRFQALTIIAKNPTKYGFPKLSEKFDQETSEYVTVTGSYRLSEIAQALGETTEKLTDFNPALMRGVTPPDGPSYPLRIPAGKKPVLLAKLNQLKQDNQQRQVYHVVSRGDTLGSILKKYNTNKTILAGLNPDVNLNKRLIRGHRLVIPVITNRPKNVSEVSSVRNRSRPHGS